MNADARLLLNKMRGRGGGGRKIISVTDARDILKRKHAQRKNVGPLKRITVQNNRFNQNFQRSNNFNRNKGYNNRTNQANFNNKRQGLSRNITNRSPGFIVKRDKQGIIQKTIRGNVRENKQVFSNRSGITVVKKLSSNEPNFVAMEEDGDELERMTLADLPDVRLPPGLLPSGTSAQFTSSIAPSSVPVTSRLNLSKNSMIADTISSNQNHTANRSILVSNLLPSVSEQDIVELFGSIGHLVNVQTLRSGEMIVEYNSHIDALMAIAKFNGLSLDQQVMHCSLFSGQERTLSSRLGERPSNFTSIATSSATSFNQESSARKNVKFIVQLP